MPSSAPYRHNSSGMLLALISAAFAGQALGAAGRVDFATDGVTVAGRDGQQRPLAKGAELDSGDNVRTSSNGRAQIRFSDGSYVSLQPNTDFAINEYKFEGKDDDRGFFGLVRGAMRTVTGAVGKVNRNSYRITTPTATVGIRGTGGVVQVLNDGSTLVIGTSGIWSLSNSSGSIDIPAGVSGLAPKETNTPPRETNTQPQTKPAEVPPPKQVDYKKGDDVNDEGQQADVAAVIPPPAPPQIVPLVSGSGYQLISAFSSSTIEGTTIASQSVNASFNASGQLTGAVGPNFTHMFGSGATHADFGTDGILAWGRWTGPVDNCSGSFCTTDTYNANQGLHYVVGMPTAVMPTTGNATYSLMGASRPTYSDGSAAPGTLLSNSQLMITFGATHTIGANLNVAMSDGKGYNLNGTTTSSTSLFSMSPTISGTAGGACGQGCSGSISGFFAGASAERAGAGFIVFDNTSAKQVVGAGAFKKD